jgi:hypothetical protein
MTRLFAVISLGTLLLVSPARAQVGNWLEGLWPTFEQIPLPHADILFDPWLMNYPDFWFCFDVPEQCE